MSDYPREGAHHEHPDDETTYRPARPRTPAAKGRVEPRRQMDLELQNRLGQLADDYDSLKRSHHDMTDRLMEIRRALWGPEDDRQRAVEPGMVQIVYELSEASKRRAAISGALKVGITTIGVGNLIFIITIIVRLLTGQDPLP